MDINEIIIRLKKLSDPSSPLSIHKASLKSIKAQSEAKIAGFMSKRAKSMEVKAARADGKSVTESEHIARISKRYEDRKRKEFKLSLDAEIARAEHNNLVMERDTLKTELSAIQSQLKLK